MMDLLWMLLVTLTIILKPISTGPPSAPMVRSASYHISKRPIHTVSDKFLSFTIDPITIKHVAGCQLTNATMNIARSLTPSYIRLAGSESNKFVFQSNPFSNNSETGSNKHEGYTISGFEWLQMNDFFAKTGMNVIACVGGGTETGNKNWDLSNTLEFITFSDKHDINLDWQLGYELERVAIEQGKNMGHDVTRLRKILDVFPRYRKSLIIGPDMITFKSILDATFVRDYVKEAGDSLNAFTWHPFSTNAENDDYNILSDGMTTMDNYLWIKDGALKSTSRGVVPKKSIWIAESENKDSISNLSDAMTWVKRMGAAARLGASVYLRKPHLLSFYEPTPEYWVAVFYKSLVGKTVLDIKPIAGNGTNQVHMFTHCTQTVDKRENSIINPQVAYERGSITIYGANTGSESARLSFKIGLRGDETAHLYILTEDSSDSFPKTLLNKQPLGLSPENELPMVSPKIRESPKYLVVPARSIFFIVFPDTKCRSCNQQLDDQSKNKIGEEEDQDTNTFTNNVLEAIEDDNDQDAIYVSYPKRTENTLQWSESSLDDKIEIPNTSRNTKYVTFSEDTWMSSFPEKLKDVLKKENEPGEKKDKSKVEKYLKLAQAVMGRHARNVFEKNLKSTNQQNNEDEPFLSKDDMISHLESHQPAGRFRRSYEPSKYKKWTNKDEWSSKTEGMKLALNKINENDTSTKLDPQVPIKMTEQNDGYFDEIESFHLENQKRSVPIYAIPRSDNNAAEILSSYKHNAPVLGMIRRTKLAEDSVSPSERIKRSTAILENSTISLASPKSEEFVSFPQSTALPVNKTSDESKLEENTTTSTQPSIILSSDLQRYSSSVPETFMESDNLTISRGYREVADKPEPENDSMIGAKHNDRPNFGPVSPFPKKPKTAKSKTKNPRSNNVQMNRQSTIEETTQYASTPTSTQEAPVINSEQTDRSASITTTTQSVSHAQTDLVSELKSAMSNLEDTPDVNTTESRTKTTLVPKSNTHHARSLVGKSRETKSKIVPVKGIRSSQRASDGIVKVTGDDESQIGLYPLRYQRRNELREEKRAKANDWFNRFKNNEVYEEQPVFRKRDVIEDAYESTKTLLNNAGSTVSDNFKSFTHWIKQKSVDLGQRLNRSRRDVDSVETPQATKRSKSSKSFEEQLEERKQELHRKLKKAQQRIEEIKNRKSQHPPAPKRNKRDVQDVRDKVNELSKKAQIRRNEMQKKVDERIHGKNSPQNRRPKLKTKSVKPEESRLKAEEPHHANIEVHHHSPTIAEPRHSAKVEEPPSQHTSKPEELHLSETDEPHHLEAAKRSNPLRGEDTIKQKPHQKHKRDLTNNHLSDNAGSDLIKDLHFRYFVDPVLNAQEDPSLDPIPSDKFERAKRSLSDNEILDDEDDGKIKPESIDHDEEHQKTEFNRLNDLTQVTTKPSTVFSINRLENNANFIPKNRICQIANYNVFGYLWCLAEKVFYYLF